MRIKFQRTRKNKDLRKKQNKKYSAKSKQEKDARRKKLEEKKSKYDGKGHNCLLK